MKDLKQLRKEKGLSQRQLAKKLGITNSTICRYETGQRDVLLSTALKMAKFFGYTVEQLFGEEVKPVPVIMGNDVVGLNNKVYQVPTCSNCENPTYSEDICPFCGSELDYGGIK